MVRAPVAVGLCALLMAVPSLVTAQSRATFGKARLIVSRGDETEAVKVHLVFHEDRLEIRADETRTLLKTFPYERITNAEYSYSKRPRWKSGAVLAVAVGVFALPVFFMKGKRHWLTIVGDGDVALLQLDKTNYKLILPTLESRAKVTVETVGDEK